MISRNAYIISILAVVAVMFVLFSKPNVRHHDEKNEAEDSRRHREVEAMTGAVTSTGQVFRPPSRSTEYPSHDNIESQYSNPYLSIREKHPVLAYQYAHDKGINPANIGDPIRSPMIGGGAMGLYGEPTSFSDSLLFSRGSFPTGLGPKGRDEDLIAGPGNSRENYSREGDGYARRREAYSNGEGPYPGKPMNVPVPANSLKISNEQYNPDMFRFSKLAQGTIGTAVPLHVNGVPLPGVGAYSSGSASYGAAERTAALGYGGNNNRGGYNMPYTGGGMPEYVTPPGADLPPQTRPLYSGDYFRPYGPNIPVSNVPFIGSVNAYAPFPEVNNPWEKAGVLSSQSGKERLLNLYRRPIAPLQDLWEYQVQDKNGFVIKLNAKYLQNGDIVHHITGEEGGPWKVHDYVQNKYIWV